MKGHLDILKWLINNNHPFNYNDLVDNASWNGHDDILLWIKSNLISTSTS